MENVIRKYNLSKKKKKKLLDEMLQLFEKYKNYDSEKAPEEEKK